MAKRLFQAIWRTNRTFLLALAALVVLNLIAFVAIFSVISPRVEELEKRYIQTQGDARQTAQRQEELASPQKRFMQNREDLQSFWEAIPDRAEFTSLIAEIFSLAEESHLSIDRVTYEPKVDPGSNLLRYAMGFSVTGNYADIKKFIHSLEQSPRIIALEELSLAGKEGSEGREGVSLRIRLSTYFKSTTS